MNGLKISNRLSKSFGRHRPFTLKSIEHGKRWYLNLEPSAKAMDDWREALARCLWVNASQMPDGANNEYILTFDPLW